ncbi:MAG: hypothetical protein D6785_06670, partial [Planctomycetota bacterium]
MKIEKAWETARKEWQDFQKDSCSKNKKKRVLFPIEKIEPFLLLERVKNSFKFFWKDRDSANFSLAFGICQIICQPWSSLESFFWENAFEASQDSFRWFGTPGFDMFSSFPIPESYWGEAQKPLLVLPILEIRRENQDFYLILNLMPYENEEETDNRVFPELCRKEELRTENLDKGHSPSFCFYQDLPQQDEWMKRIENLKARLNGKGLSKGVLARARIYQLVQPSWSPYQAFYKLEQKEQKGFSFFIKWHNNIFLGKSPELLFYRQGEDLRSEALAGTIVKSVANAKEELRNCSKNRLEHKWVLEGIQ